MSVETVVAESEKFTASLVLVHGLWSEPAVWRRFMGLLAHRGWTCHAVRLPGRSMETDDARSLALRDYVQVVRDVVAACAAPPIVLGHDVGAFLAMSGAAEYARAVIAMAPLLPGDLLRRNPAVTGLRQRLALAWGRAVPPPGGRRAQAYFGAGAGSPPAPEPWAVVRDLLAWSGAPTIALPVPALVVAATADPFCPRDALAVWAARCGAEVRAVPGADHGLPWMTGWESRANEIHRWLVQRLGEPLLLPCEDDDDE
jgi:pimeloyl-ACP methyl ester carboxylesterase